MLKLTPEILQKIATTATKTNCGIYAPLIQKYAEENEVTTPVRMSCFLSNVLHESNALNATVENLNYDAAGLLRTWPSRFTKEQAAQYARKPISIANKVYADRGGNGDEKSGDGYKYRGRGLMQTTLKENYIALSEGLFGEGDTTFVDKPELLQQPEYAVRAAFFYWDSKCLNAIADTVDPKKPLTDVVNKANFTTLRKKINGGIIGLEHCMEYYNRAIRNIF